MRNGISYRHLNLQDAGNICLGLFKKIFSEIVKGRRDYENLLPST